MSMQGSTSTSVKSAVDNMIASDVAVAVAAGNNLGDACFVSPADVANVSLTYYSVEPFQVVPTQCYILIFKRDTLFRYHLHLSDIIPKYMKYIKDFFEWGKSGK